MRFYGVLCAALGLVLNVQGADATRPAPVCRAIAAMLRSGFGNVPSEEEHVYLLPKLAARLPHRVTIAPWETSGERRAAILKAVGLPVYPGINNPEIATLPQRQLVVVATREGNSQFPESVVYRSEHDRLVPIATPFVLRVLACDRCGDAQWLGALDGKPFVALSTGGDERIDIAPWNGKDWDHICSIEVRYVIKFISERSVCRLDDCSAAEAVVEQLAAKRFAQYLGYAEPRGDSEQSDLPELATSLADLNGVLTDDGPLHDTFWPERTQTMVMIDKRPTLVVMGNMKAGPAIDSQVIGAFATLWQQDGDPIILVATFNLRIDRSQVKTAFVTP